MRRLNKRIKTTVKLIATAGIVLLALVLLLAVAFSIRSTRDVLLHHLIDRAQSSLPGTVRASDASWSTPGRIDVENFSWIDGADTLLTVERLIVEIKLLPLLKRDVCISELALDGVTADVPAIRERFPDSHPQEPPPVRTDKKRFFPREGSVAGSPSLAIDRLTLNVTEIVVGTRGSVEDRLTPTETPAADDIVTFPGSRSASLELAGSIDLSRGRASAVRLERLRAVEATSGLRVDRAWLDIDLAMGKLEGRGSGEIAPEWPFFLSVNSTGDNRFSLVITQREGVAPPDTSGVTVSGSFERQGLGIRSLQYEALVKTPGVEDLAKIPALRESLDRLEPLEGITAMIHGSFRFQPVLKASAIIELHSCSWLEGGNVSIAYEDNIVHVDTVAINLPDLSLDGTASLMRDSLTVSLDASASGLRWLQNLLPQFAAPEDFSAKASLQVSGTKQTPNLSLSLSAKGRKDGFELDELYIGTEAPGDKNLPLRVHLAAVTRGLAVSTNAEIERNGDIVARISPFVVQYASDPTRRGLEAGRTGIIRYQQKNKQISLDRVKIAGALGDIYLNGKMGGDAPGSYRIHCLWPEAPDILTRSLKTQPNRIDSLRTRWRQTAPFHLDITGRLNITDGQTNNINGTFIFPPPSVLSALSSHPFRFDDLGPLRGSFSAQTRTSQEGLLYDLELDLNPTDWIDSSVVRLSGVGADLEIDTVGIAVEDVSVALNGGLNEGVWDLRCALGFESARLLRRFDLKDENLDLTLRAKADFSGTIKSPRLRVSVGAHAVGSNYRVPEINANATWSERGLFTTIDVPQGADADILRLTRFGASYRSESDQGKLLPGKLMMSGGGPGIDFLQAITLDKTREHWIITGDSLNLAVSGRDLRNSRTFSLAFHPSEQKIEVNDLLLSGGLGKIEAEGILGPAYADLNISAHVMFPKMPSSLNLPTALWPERLDLYLQVADKNRLRSELKVGGVILPDGRRPDVRIHISSKQDTFHTDIFMTERLDTMVTCRLEFPASLSLFPPKASLRDGPLYMDAALNDFPVPTEVRSDYLSSSRLANCNAGFYVRGTTGRPSVAGEARITFPDWPKLSDYSLDFETRLTPQGDTLGILNGGKLPTSGRFQAQFGALNADGLEILLVAKRNHRQLLKATSLLPLTFSILPLKMDVSKNRESRFHLASEELMLSEFDALLPPNVGMGGRCVLRLDATGPLEDPNLDGSVSVREFQMSLENGSRVSAHGSLQLAGTAVRPSLKGMIEIESGVIRIPEPPKDLHPTVGSAVLWEHTLIDSVNGSPAATALATAAADSLASSEKTRVEAKFDVTIQIPSGLWVRGRGLNVELTGDLRLVQKGVYPTVTGELRAVHGNLIFVGRNFNMEKGTVNFYGEEKIDPSLDIILSTKVEDVLIRIAFRGTVQKPDLKMTSEPEMTEGDIISFLLFGKSIDDLDHDQANLLQRRASELAASFGLVQLETRLARRLGVDLVTIQKSRRDEKQKALVIGKYLSRRALLKYERLLEEQASFFVNLEYFLTRNFKIETIIGKQNQSGIEADWTKDY